MISIHNLLESFTIIIMRFSSHKMKIIFKRRYIYSIRGQKLNFWITMEIYFSSISMVQCEMNKSVSKHIHTLYNNTKNTKNNTKNQLLSNNSTFFFVSYPFYSKISQPQDKFPRRHDPPIQSSLCSPHSHPYLYKNM